MPRSFSIILFLCHLCSFSLERVPVFHSRQYTFFFVVVLVSDQSVHLVFPVPISPLVVPSYPVFDSGHARSLRSASGPAADRFGRYRSCIRYVHVLTIVDFIKANEFAKRSRILQTCRHKTDVDTLQVGPHRAISPCQGIRFARRPQDARHCGIDVPDDPPSERNIRTLTTRCSRNEVYLRERAQIHLIRLRNSADRIEILETARRTNCSVRG